MQQVTFPEFLTLSHLGIRWDGKITEDPTTGVRTPEWSKVAYHIDFHGEEWSYHYDGERVEDVVAEFCRKFNLISEEIGYNAFILHETISGKVKNQQNLLHARARAVNGIYTALYKNRERMEQIALERAHRKVSEECKEYHSAYAEMTAFGQIYGGEILDPSHPRTCQMCRFWKAEHDRKIAKVNSKPGTLIDEVS